MEKTIQRFDLCRSPWYLGIHPIAGDVCLVRVWMTLPDRTCLKETKYGWTVEPPLFVRSWCNWCSGGSGVRIYPLVICYIAIENDHRNSGFPINSMVIFHSYVKLPEGSNNPNRCVATSGQLWRHVVSSIFAGSLRFRGAEKFPSILQARNIFPSKHVLCTSYNVGPPSDVCWFINPHNYGYKYHKHP